MSLGSLLSTARSGKLAAQRAAESAAQQPIRYPNGEFGAGVRILGTTRARDLFLDATFRRSSADAAGSRTRSAARMINTADSMMQTLLDLRR